MTDILTHDPLPYTVVIASSVDDDSPVETSSHDIVAYSVLEAMIQATSLATGSVEGVSKRARVISVGPNVAKFFEMARQKRELEDAARKGR